MKVILAENIPSLGEIGKVVNVAPGYARNYLLPQGLAQEATGKNVRELEHRKRILARKREKVRQEMLSRAEKLNQVKIAMRRKVSEEDKLYGSVTSMDIADELQKQGITIDRRKIILDKPIKSLGEFSVSIKLHPQVTAPIKVRVVSEQ